MNNTTHIPYTYLIGWTNSQMFYYGSRTAKNCKPSELWKTYFTSSGYVKNYRQKYGEPDIIQIRKTFKDTDSCYNWETKVLIRLNARLHTKFLNESNNDGYSNNYNKVNVKDKDGNRLRVNTDDPRFLSGELVHITAGTITVKDKDGNRFQVNDDDPRYLSGELVPAIKGIKHKQATCPHCNKTCTVSMIARWHTDNCKFKTVDVSEILF